MCDNRKMRYALPTQEYIYNERNLFQQMLGGFATFEQVNVNDFSVDRELVDEVTKRVHQRIEYYSYFHGVNLEQTRQAATKAYWILRYRPLKPKLWGKQYDVNIHFAFYVLFAAVIGKSIKDIPKNIQKSVINAVLSKQKDIYLRSFSEYDISKEAMMLVAESVKSLLEAEIIKHT